jgi:hypothetical protein
MAKVWVVTCSGDIKQIKSNESSIMLITLIVLFVHTQEVSAIMAARLRVINPSVAFGVIGARSRSTIAGATLSSSLSFLAYAVGHMRNCTAADDEHMI